jgi:hypothetical protein
MDIEVTLRKFIPLFEKLNPTLKLLFMLDLETILAKFSKVIDLLMMSEQEQPVNQEDFTMNIIWPDQSASLVNVMEELLNHNIIGQDDLDAKIPIGLMKKNCLTYCGLIQCLSTEEEFKTYQKAIQHLFYVPVEKQYKDYEGAEKVKRIVVFLAKKDSYYWLQEFREKISLWRE